MSGSAAVLLVVAVLTLCGLGVLAVLGAARTVGEIARLSPVAPLAGMAWVGIAAATAATIGLPFGVAGLLLVTGLTCAPGLARLLRSKVPASAVTPVPVRSPGRHRTIEAGLAAAGTALLAIVCGFALVTYRLKPLVEYDGWAMWGMKAKAIAWLDADPAVLGSEVYTRLHLEYPLLLPALHALPIDAAGSFTSNIVVLNCVLVGLAGLLAMWGLLRERVRPALLLSSLAAVTAMPAFFVQLGAGYADVSVAVVVAAGVAAAARWLVDGRTAWLALATLFLAASALTKNEGLLFGACILVPLLAVATGRRRAVGLAAGVVALVYLPWRVFMAAHDLESADYELSSSFDPSRARLHLERVPDAAWGVASRGFDPYEVGFVLALGLGACALSLLLACSRLGLFAGGFALLSLAGLTWIYVISERELSSYLSSSAHRVVLSSVIGLAALYPLLIEECARTVSARGDPSPDAGSLS